ncbi:MAG: glycosyltransferase [Phycisphaerales bacterium]|nr:glycosyltransferase [Phycisphaerales bacterium]
MATITIILPVYNEAWLIGSVMTRVIEHAESHPDQHILIVDDGSTDRTPELVGERLGRVDHDRITLLRHERNQGKAEAIITGLRHSTDPLVCYTDGDLAYSLDHVDQLLEALQDADVAIGSRALAGASQRNISWHRRLFGETFNLLVRLILGIPHRDTQAGLKGFTFEAATRLFSRLKTRNFAFDAELLYLARKEQMRVVEIPAHVSVRHSYKVSTMNMFRDPLTMLWSVCKVRARHAVRKPSESNTIVESKACAAHADHEGMVTMASEEPIS